MPAMPHPLREEIKRFIRYAYFLRFSISLWLFAVFLSFLNSGAGATLSSGILAPEFISQYICVGFFLASAAFVALISARVVLINGIERWDVCYQPKAEGDAKDDGRPYLLKNWLVNDLGEHELAAVLISQLPNLGILIYLIHNSDASGVSGWTTFLGLVLGFLLAFVVWGTANAWYYLTYQPVEEYDIVKFGKNAARTLLFPRTLFKLQKIGHTYGVEKVGGSEREVVTLENASTWLDRTRADRWLRAIARVFRTPGYTYKSKNGIFKFYEGHTFSILAIFVFLGIYLLIWPLAAPVSTPVATPIALVILGLFCSFLISVFLVSPPNNPRKIRPYQKLTLSGIIVAFFISVLGLQHCTAPERFPTLALILIVVISLCWLFCGLSFFLDRYRVPVMTVFLVFIIVPRAAHWDHGKEEHFLSVVSLKADNVLAKKEVPTPAAILDQALTSDVAEQPLIIITATGGGLHASAWTTAVLEQLERRFPATSSTDSFHRHILLASTVSGGSVGLYSYLEEIHETTPDYARMQVAAQCSSLEAVGWGLAYYDLPKAVIPILPYVISPSTGVDDMNDAQTPLWKDRTWSLRRGYLRNQGNSYCYKAWNKDHPDVMFQQPKAYEDGGRLSLRSLIPEGKEHFAFTMNTTAEETGDRFLLANYKLAEDQVDKPLNYRAKSFLQTFKTATSGGCGADVSDLPMATAAQLSATFPYVSSAARVPRKFDDVDYSVHFVDGGYYDNDGTASAVEFLRYALAQPASASQLSPASPPCGFSAKSATATKMTEHDYLADIQKRLNGRPLRILLIEIRNSSDEADTGPEVLGYHTDTDKKRGNLLTQLGAPISGFWQAGHASITGRNRILLAQLEHAMSGKLQVHRVVFDDKHALEGRIKTDPLSWSLTPWQRQEIQASAKGCDMIPKYEDVKEWFSTPSKWDDSTVDSGKPE